MVISRISTKRTDIAYGREEVDDHWQEAERHLQQVVECECHEGLHSVQLVIRVVNRITVHVRVYQEGRGGQDEWKAHEKHHY